MQIYTKIKNSWKFCHLLITVISILIYYSWPFFLKICVYEICIYKIRNLSHLGIYVYVTLSREDPDLNGGGNDNPLQYSRLENSMDRETWQATAHGDHKESGMTKRLNTCMCARAHTHTHTHSVCVYASYCFNLLLMYFQV